MFAWLGQCVTADRVWLASCRWTGETGAQPPSARLARDSCQLGGMQGQGTGKEGERMAAGGLRGDSSEDGGFVACRKEVEGEECPKALEGRAPGWGLEVLVAVR